jgi:hypothetical protein
MLITCKEATVMQPVPVPPAGMPEVFWIPDLVCMRVPPFPPCRHTPRAPPSLPPFHQADMALQPFLERFQLALAACQGHDLGTLHDGAIITWLVRKRVGTRDERGGVRGRWTRTAGALVHSDCDNTRFAAYARMHVLLSSPHSCLHGMTAPFLLPPHPCPGTPCSSCCPATVSC